MSDLIEQAQAEVEDDGKVVLNTSHARAMLRARYAAPEWALLEEVAPSTGGGTRYADAVAVNLWSSRGHAVHGFEIKVSRSDWLRELKDPAKAEPVQRFCDHWWIVAPKGVVKDGELPITWGHIELRSGGLVIKTGAPRLQAQPLDRGFFASLMRRGLESLDARAGRMVQEETVKARQAIAQGIADGVRLRTRDIEEQQRHLKRIEEETGLKLGDRWTGPPISTIKLAQALQRLSSYGTDHLLGELDRLATKLDSAAVTVREGLQAFRAAHPEQQPNPESTHA